MKKILLAATLAATSATAAQAADLAVKAPVYKAPVAKAYDWTGFYFGVNGGVGLDRSYTGLGVAASPATNGGTPASRVGGTGAIGGVQLGYNWQYGNLLGLGNIVLGVEGDFQGSGMRDNSTCVYGCAGGFGFGINQTLDWFGTARARVGLATGPVLTYFTGGFAAGGVKTTITDLSSGSATSFNNTRTGWTLGSGVEAALGGNWTGKIEYLYVDLGTQNGVSPVGAANPYGFNSDIREQIFRVGLNYRLGQTGVYTPEPVRNWTGFYGGLNVGGATAMNQGSLSGFAGGLTETFNVAPDGYIGGGQIGYDFQAGSTVFGVIADLQGSTQRDNQVCELTCLSPATSYAAFDQRMEWFGTARGRIGYALGSTLFYATGGLAYGGIKTRISGDLLGSPFDSTFTHEKTGYAAGAGIESPLSFLGLFGPQWTVSGEYLFVDLGRVTDSVATGAGTNLTYSTRVQEHIFRTGINYHFNQPVVAKY